MTYTHLTPTELVMIEAYFNQMHSVSKVAKRLQRSRQTIYNVYRFLKNGGSAISYYEQYKKNKLAVADVLLFYQKNKKNIFEQKLFKVGHLM